MPSPRRLTAPAWIAVLRERVACRGLCAGTMSRSFCALRTKEDTFLLRWRSKQVGFGCVCVIDRLVGDREFGGVELFPLPRTRRERPIQDAARQQRPLDRVTRPPRVDHGLDGLQQICEVRVPRLGSF